MDTKEVFKKLETLSEMIPLEILVFKMKQDLNNYGKAVKFKDKEKIKLSKGQLMLDVKVLLEKFDNEDKTEESASKTEAFLTDELKKMKKRLTDENL
jgi:hypothetical protein